MTDAGLILVRTKRYGVLPPHERIEDYHTDTCAIVHSMSIELNQDAWNEWVAYRIRIKKPLKPANYAWTMKGLAKFGKDQMAVVQQSMEREYHGLFPLKEDATMNASLDVKAPW